MGLPRIGREGDRDFMAEKRAWDYADTANLPVQTFSLGKVQK